MINRCVVVIGHVDHGKTALVRALTGTDTDRLAEEKARGLSITPGFAHCQYQGGIIDLVDAPGHEDFIQAMIGGASGAQAALLVVSAVEGIAVQTREHLAIIGALGISHGVIAVTKSDALSAGAKPAALGDICADLKDSALRDAPVVLCSALRGDGIDRVHVALEGLLSLPIHVSGPLHSFLPVDRVFTVEGRGTVVTGTLQGATMYAGNEMIVQPTDLPTTLRGLQTHGTDQTTVRPGQRVAASLRGVSLDQIARGAVLCAPEHFAGSDCMDVHLGLHAEIGQGVKHMQQVRVLIGTQSAVAQLRLYGGKQIAVGHCGFGQLRFAKPLTGYAGQRAILRRLSPAGMLGGAVVLDPNARPTVGGDAQRLAVLEASYSEDALAIAAALGSAQHGRVDVNRLARLARMHVEDAVAALSNTHIQLDANTYASHNDIETCTNQLTERLAAYHAAHPLRRFAPWGEVAGRTHSPLLLNHVRAALIANDVLHATDTQVALKTHDPMAFLSPPQHARMREIEDAFARAALSPPLIASLIKEETDADLVALLTDTRQLVALYNIGLKQTVTLHRSAIGHAIAALCEAFRDDTPFTTGQARDALGTSRRIIVPLLEHLDDLNLTQRNNNHRHFTSANVVPPTQTD